MKYRILGEVFGSGRRKEEIQVTFPKAVYNFPFPSFPKTLREWKMKQKLRESQGTVNEDDIDNERGSKGRRVLEREEKYQENEKGRINLRDSRDIIPVLSLAPKQLLV